MTLQYLEYNIVPGERTQWRYTHDYNIRNIILFLEKELNGSGRIHKKRSQFDLFVKPINRCG